MSQAQNQMMMTLESYKSNNPKDDGKKKQKSQKEKDEESSRKESDKEVLQKRKDQLFNINWKLAACKHQLNKAKKNVDKPSILIASVFEST